MVPVGIVVHDTATDQRRVEPYLTSWNKGGVKKCVHAFIGQRPDGSAPPTGGFNGQKSDGTTPPERPTGTPPQTDPGGTTA